MKVNIKGIIIPQNGILNNNKKIFGEILLLKIKITIKNINIPIPTKTKIFIVFNQKDDNLFLVISKIKYTIK